MDQHYKQLYNSLNIELQQVAAERETTLQRAIKSLPITQKYMGLIKQRCLDHPPASTEEQIQFFKKVKPTFLREHIFMQQLCRTETIRPVGSKDVIVAYYRQVQQQIGFFFEKNQNLYIYHRTGRSDEDERLFTSQAGEWPGMPEYTLDLDTRFSTVYSSRLGEILAYEQLAEYVASRLDQQQKAEVFGNEFDDDELFWTDTHSSLIELAYAIYSKRSVNRGDMTLKRLISKLEMAFNIRLGNFYQTIKNMRARKKQRTPYLHELIESAEKNMDATDLDF